MEAFSSYSLAIPLLPEGSTNLPAADKPILQKFCFQLSPHIHVHAQYLFLLRQREPVFTDNSCTGTSSGDAGGASGPGHLPGDKAPGVASREICPP